MAPHGPPCLVQDGRHPLAAPRGPAAAALARSLQPSKSRNAVSSPAVAPAQVVQSVLDARGDAASHILEITWVLFIGGGLIFVAVMALCAAAVAGPAPLRNWLSQRRVVIGAGIVFPVI